ncbi:hypothetical protein Thiowin_02210 [Thiorhodovibrio winogradskyi]|uniref:YARHG domain-containing protein n=1 Tax=Thiorhodovibrio winogradskyi TaxID=77007 RepID=A0ABZ0S9L6_9GAMM|nr:YARHG domain-containing protein [Thiorhodovibrio winogradskyi]
MKKLICIVFAVMGSAQVQAESCYDLWYERNLIYAENGYCFSTNLGQSTFSEYSCWTKSPSLSTDEQRRVAALKAEEKRRGCKVNTGQVPQSKPVVSSAGVAIVYDPPSNVRNRPNGEILCSVRNQSTINIHGSENGWYRTDVCGTPGYIHKSQIRF